MIDFQVALRCVTRMAILNYFPKEGDARAAIAEMVIDMVDTPEQAMWLARRMVELHNDWPGPREMRAVFCSRFRPRDGIEVNSTVYVDGIPSERVQQLELPAPNPRSRITTADSEMSSAIALLAKNSGKRGA